MAPEFRGSLISALRIALALAVITLSLAPARANDADSLVPWIAGRPALFVLDDLSRQATPLSAQRSQIVLVHFFATWCEPCRDELASLRRLVERSAPEQLRVIAISVAEVDIRVRNYIEKTPVNFPVLLDRDRAVARSWSVSALPTSFILDQSLKPRLFVERDYDWDKLDVPALLASFAAAPAHKRNLSIATFKPEESLKEKAQ